MATDRRDLLFIVLSRLEASLLAGDALSRRTLLRIFRRFRLPRLLFDYLHLRQYGRGYMDYLRENRDADGHLD